MQNDLKLCFGCMEESHGETVCPHCGYSADTPHLPAYLAPGSVLNKRYIAGKLLSHNGESAVYIGYDEQNGVKVFIREYMPTTLCRRIKDSKVVAVNQDAVAQYKTFMSEFVELNKTLARLRGLSHINPAIDMFGDNNTGYVVFNYIEGRPLADILRDSGGVMSWAETKKMFPPIFTTLSLIHNAGLIHRGICPENILVTPRNELFLDNFCVADERTAETELDSEVYDGYAAPEQYSSGKWQGTWTDVYGICALLYRLLTGIVPENACEREKTDELVPPHEINEDIPEAVSDVIMNGLALSKEERIQTVTELVTGLFNEVAEAKSPMTEPVIISRPNSFDDGYEESYYDHSRRNEASYSRSRAAKAPEKSKVFVLAGFAAAVVLIAILAVVMLALDDNSHYIADNISIRNEQTTVSRADLDELAESLASQTSAPEETESNQPTLNEVENGESSSATMRSENVYIMNELVGKNYETIKNSPTYESLSFMPKYEFNEENPKGTIFSQSIEKGETYTEGQEIVIKVSLGSRYVKVPDYSGMTAKDYFNLLEGKNIKYEEASYETKEYKNGYVCGISAEDEIIDLESGDTLIVYVAYNPTPVTEETTEESTEETTEETEEETEEETTYDDEEYTDESDYSEDYDETEEYYETDLTDEEYNDDDIEIEDPNYSEVEG